MPVMKLSVSKLQSQFVSTQLRTQQSCKFCTTGDVEIESVALLCPPALNETCLSKNVDTLPVNVLTQFGDKIVFGRLCDADIVQREKGDPVKISGVHLWHECFKSDLAQSRNRRIFVQKLVNIVKVFFVQ